MIQISRFNNLSNDKQEIMLRLIEDEELCKALICNKRDFINESDLYDPYEDILYKHIFPFRFKPGLDDAEKNYITMSFRNYRLHQGYYKSGLIYLYVIVPRNPNVIRTEYGFRDDFLISKIDKIMNDSRDIGIGKLQFYAMDEFDVNDKYIGQYIAYKPMELN